MAGSGVSEEALARSLSVYVGMVDKVLADPERWLGVDEEQGASAGIGERAVEAVKDRAWGTVNPASPEWAEQPLDARVDWWVNRVSLGAGLAAAAPRLAGALSDRLPLQAALGASAAGLAVCAVAREHGVSEPAHWVPLLARVLFERELTPKAASVPAAAESERALLENDENDGRAPGLIGSVGRQAQHSVQTLWRLAATFRGVQHLLDERPRGPLLARALGKLPVVGVAGGWLDERGAIRSAAKETAQLLK